MAKRRTASPNRATNRYENSDSFVKNPLDGLSWNTGSNPTVRTKPLVIVLLLLTVALRADEVLFRYEGDVRPENGGMTLFDSCSSGNLCTDFVEEGRYVIEWEGGDPVNYDHNISVDPEEPPSILWIEAHFRSNWPLPPGDDGCDGRFVAHFRDVFDLVWLHGDRAVSFSGDEFSPLLPLNQFYTTRFESRDGTSFRFAVNGRVFFARTEHQPAGSSGLQFGGLAFCNRPLGTIIRNEWDFIRYGTISDGEAIVAADPPAGVLDANQYPKLDRFTITFDQPGYVYVDDVGVDSTGAVPQVQWTRRPDNGGPETVEIVLDRPLAVGHTTTFTFDTGAEPQIIEYTYVILGACCLPGGACLETDQADCQSQEGQFTPDGTCSGDADGDGVDTSCGACPDDAFKTAPG
jgi:hypothetical protein